MDWITQFFTEILWLFNEMSPYLLLGFFIAGVLRVFVPPGRMTQWLGKPTWKSAVYSAFLGVPLPLCSCGVIPTGVSLHANGASKGASVSFLISTPQTGVDSILVTYSLMGWPFAIIRPIVAFVSGVIGGGLTNAMTSKEKEVVKDQSVTSEFKGSKVKELFRYAFVEFLEDIAKWLVIGLVIAAAITTFLPDSLFTEYLSSPWLSMLVILVASIPMYVCATGSVPIAAALMMKGLSPGAAFVFLMAGPATNAGTITVIAKSLGKKSLYAYLISIIGMSLATGGIIDQFLPAEWFQLGSMGAHDHHESHMLPLWLQWGSSAILGILLLNVMFRKYFPKAIGRSEASDCTCTTGEGSESSGSETENEKHERKMNSEIEVGGMTCNHCKASVEKNLTALDSVSEAVVDLSNGHVTLKGDAVDLKEVESTVNSLGYEYKGEVK